ncbi:YcaO-like family protein, partial [bacterium]|nr:YcaO-like family protein [bacterium]
MKNITEGNWRCRKRHRDGTHRLRSPRKTLDAYLPFTAHCGVTRIANITGLDSVGIPVWVALRPNSRSLVTAQGKGLDHDSARASALMESLETWHAENITLPLRWDSYEALRRSSHVVDVSRIPLCPDARFDLDAPMLWMEGFDLMQSYHIWVPFEAVMLNLVYASQYRSSFPITSNGLASGNHMLEAIVH